MNAILQAFLDAMVNDDGSGTTGDLMDKTWWTDLIGRLDTVISLAGLSIEKDQIYYVSSTGSDTTGDGSLAQPWATVDHAIESLRSYRIPPGGSCTLQVDDGEYTITASLTNLPAGITVTGKNSMLRSITSVQSSSGTSGDYSIVLNVFDVSSIEVGDECTVFEVSGGTSPKELLGTFEITDVDAVNSRITIHSPGNGVPSGMVEASCRIYKTRIQASGVSGVIANTDFGLENLALIGDESADTYGVSVSSAEVTLTNVAIRDFGTGGLYVEGHGSILGENVVLYYPGTYGVNCQSGGYISSTGLVIVHSSGQGIFCQFSGTVIAPDVLIYKSGAAGIDCRYSSSVVAEGAIVYNASGYGLSAQWQASIQADACELANNSSGGGLANSNSSLMITNCTNTGKIKAIYKSFVYLLNGEAATTIDFAIEALAYSYVYAANATITGTTVPSVNTQGNTYSYITHS